MSGLFPFLGVLAVAVLIAVAAVFLMASVRWICKPSTKSLYRSEGHEMPPFLLRTSVDDFLEFLARVRQAIRQSKRA